MEGLSQITGCSGRGTHATESMVRSLMPGRFFGSAEWNEHYPALVTASKRRAVPGFPWTVEELESPCPFVAGRAVHETHFSFLLPRLRRGTKATPKGWYHVARQAFDDMARFRLVERNASVWADQQAETGLWYLLPWAKDDAAVPMLYPARVRSLPPGYHPSQVAVIVTALVLYRRLVMPDHAGSAPASISHTAWSTTELESRVATSFASHGGKLSLWKVDDSKSTRYPASAQRAQPG